MGGGGGGELNPGIQQLLNPQGFSGGYNYGNPLAAMGGAGMGFPPAVSVVASTQLAQMNFTPAQMAHVGLTFPPPHPPPRLVCADADVK
jgi:hypothetical protein